jgi:hypothetical protein
MARKTTLAWLRGLAAAASWMAAAWLVQDGAGPEMGGVIERYGEQIELHLKSKADKAPPLVVPRERTPDEPLHPWERVDV